MKQKILITILIVISINFIPRNIYAQQSKDEIQKEIKNLKVCTDMSMGITFLCDINWKIQSVNDAILIIISEKPDVTMISAKVDSNIKFLGQLTKEKLKKLKQYERGFVIENVKLGGRNFLKVKAFSREYPNRRLLDYYTVYNNSLYGIFFAVEPKKQMEEFQYLFKKIVESFSFIKNMDKKR